MAQKRKTDQSGLIVAAALELACESGWGGLTLKAVAKKAKLKPEAVTALFPDRWALLKRVLETLEKETACDVKDRLGNDWRDNLFEILMTRIDLAAPHKKAYASLPAAFRREPRALLEFAKLFFETMDKTLTLAGLPAGGLYPAHVAAFSVLSLSLVGAFLRDDAKDRSKIMATLDRRLGLFEKFVECTRCEKVKSHRKTT
ncbi:MAG: hypothetical protein V1721_03920 [Pseudomonadota bacterium]